MSRPVQQLLSALKQVKRLSSSGTKKFLKSCNKDFIHGLCEYIGNMINGRVPLKPCQLKCLSRHKHTLRKLAVKKTSLTDRKKILQNGSFLQLLLPSFVISGLGSILGYLLPSSYGTR